MLGTTTLAFCLVPLLNVTEPVYVLPASISVPENTAPFFLFVEPTVTPL